MSSSHITLAPRSTWFFHFDFGLFVGNPWERGVLTCCCSTWNLSVQRYLTAGRLVYLAAENRAAWSRCNERSVVVSWSRDLQHRWALTDGCSPYALLLKAFRRLLIPSGLLQLGMCLPRRSIVSAASVWLKVGMEAWCPPDHSRDSHPQVSLTLPRRLWGWVREWVSCSASSQSDRVGIMGGLAWLFCLVCGSAAKMRVGAALCKAPPPQRNNWSFCHGAAPHHNMT